MPRRFRMSGGSLTAPAAAVAAEFTTILATLLAILAVAAIAVFVAKHLGYVSAAPVVSQKPTVVVVDRGNPAPPTILNADPRFGPLSPERSFGTPPDMRGYPRLPLPAGLGALPVNTQTRGYPDSYQQVGVLTAPGGTANSGTPTRTILPLFGRANDSARNKWNYYTRTDGMNPVQVPLQFKRRNCDDDVGCDEILDGDNVGVPIMGQSFTANVYRYSTPRYIPV